MPSINVVVVVSVMMVSLFGVDVVVTLVSTVSVGVVVILVPLFNVWVVVSPTVVCESFVTEV